MNKGSFTKFIKDAQKAIVKRSPEILTGLGVAGLVTTTVLAVKATPKALRLIEMAEDHGIGITSKNGDPDWERRPLTKLETVKVAWKPYIPAAVTGAVSIACIIGASSVHARRNAALATAYQLSTTALSEYKEKVVETIGEKKEQQVRDKIAQDKVNKHPVSSSEVMMLSSDGVMFLEPTSNRYFVKDSKESVREIVNDLNERLTSGMEEYISLSEFYDEIGLSHTEVSDDLGWNIGRDGQIRIDFRPSETANGRLCYVLEYLVVPRYDFTRLY